MEPTGGMVHLVSHVGKMRTAVLMAGLALVGLGLFPGPHPVGTAGAVV